jgi:transcriptional regulator with XRE-family HTH domain
MYPKYAELRDKKGVRDADISKATGISPATLSDWKKGLYEPKVDKLKKLAEYFEVPLETFIS